MATGSPAPGIRRRSGPRGSNQNARLRRIPLVSSPASGRLLGRARIARVALTHPSPNFGARRGGARPSLVVIHYTAMESAEAALARLCDPAAEVSSHWLIGADGALFSLVAEEMRAWHAGAGSWGDVVDVNSASIGIELDNDGVSPFPEAQMVALEELLGGVLARWGIPPEGVIGHSDSAPGRKIDPGPRFDWGRLALSGACG